MSGALAELIAVLEHARHAGFIGRNADLDAELAHAREFGIVASGLDHCRVADLGSGGGLPGRVLAHHWPTARLHLVEASAVRATFLREAVETLGWAERVIVIHDRAETIGRQPEHREQYDVVVARSFAAPAITAECAAPLLRRGGKLVVSEPPDAEFDLRWPAEQCAGLGFGQRIQSVVEHRFGVLTRDLEVPVSVPRRPGIPSKRPRW